MCLCTLMFNLEQNTEKFDCPASIIFKFQCSFWVFNLKNNYTNFNSQHWNSNAFQLIPHCQYQFRAIQLLFHITHTDIDFQIRFVYFQLNIHWSSRFSNKFPSNCEGNQTLLLDEHTYQSMNAITQTFLFSHLASTLIYRLLVWELKWDWNLIGSKQTILAFLN